MKKFVLISVLLLFTLSIAYGMTANELYERATQKYINGDLAGAESDLQRVVQIDSQHEKGRELLIEVRKELGRAAPVAPAPVITTTTVARPAPRRPRPVPRPTVPSKTQRAHDLLVAGEKAYQDGELGEAKKYFLQVLELIPGHGGATKYVREIRQKLGSVKKLPHFLLPPPSTVSTKGMANTVKELLFIGAVFFVIIIYVLARLSAFVFKRKKAEARMIVCPDCKTRNLEEAEFCQKCGVRLKVMSGISDKQKQWFAKYGWKQNPFSLTIIPSLFTGYASQVNSILKKVSSRSGHILVYGEKGVGKTTLLKWLAENLKSENYAIYVARPPLNFDDLLRYIVAGFKPGSLARNKKYSLYEIEDLIKKAKKPVVILLDEAHEFTPEIEQHLRSLGDIDKVTYILAGLPEAREKIKKDSPPFYDRIVMETYIDQLSLADTREMIKKRIEAAGGKDVKPFTEQAIEKIYKMSRGRPRMILKVCDWTMSDAIENNLDVIGGEPKKEFPSFQEGAAAHEPPAPPQPDQPTPTK